MTPIAFYGPQYKYVKGQMVTILQVVCASQVDLHIRQAAAIHFKGVVTKDWDEEDRGTIATRAHVCRFRGRTPRGDTGLRN